MIVQTILEKDAQLPYRAHETDAGADLYYSEYEDVTIPPGTIVKLKTGVKLALPENTVGIIHDRSSMGAKGLKVMGGIS